MKENTLPIRILSQTKKELDRLMLNKMKETNDLKLTYGVFVNDLVLFYKENKK